MEMSPGHKSSWSFKIVSEKSDLHKWRTQEVCLRSLSITELSTVGEESNQDQGKEHPQRLEVAVLALTWVQE